LAAIGRTSFEGAFWPHYMRWAMAQGLQAGGESGRAETAAALAREELAKFAAEIEDDRTRAVFLSVPTNLRIAGAGEPLSHGRRTLGC
jgi:hypothetical protein